MAPYKISALPGPGAALVPLRGRVGEDAALELVSLVLKREFATGKNGKFHGRNFCSHISQVPCNCFVVNPY